MAQAAIPKTHTALANSNTDPTRSLRRHWLLWPSVKRRTAITALVSRQYRIIALWKDVGTSSKPPDKRRWSAWSSWCSSSPWSWGLLWPPALRMFASMPKAATNARSKNSSSQEDLYSSRVIGGVYGPSMISNTPTSRWLASNFV